MKGICPLASGSQGNCVYVGTDKTRLLFDVGISEKKLKERLLHIGVDLESIQGIVISHEHGDHIQGLQALSKYDIPIMANAETAKLLLKFLNNRPKLKIFTTEEPFEFHDVEIHPFRVHHDAVEPVAFTIKTPSHKIGICTDLGFVNKTAQNRLKNCDILYIESNHEEELVQRSKRPIVYKQRVLGKSGHLSNTACGELLCDIACDRLQHVYLAHLSKECNSPERALETVSHILMRHGIDIPLSIAAQDTVSCATLL